MKIIKECPECGCKKIEVMKTYCGSKDYFNGKPMEKGNFPRIYAYTKFYCDNCNWESDDKYK